MKIFEWIVIKTLKAIIDSITWLVEGLTKLIIIVGKFFRKEK